MRQRIPNTQSNSKNCVSKFKQSIKREEYAIRKKKSAEILCNINSRG